MREQGYEEIFKKYITAKIIWNSKVSLRVLHKKEAYF